jgi:hypothetical protein
MRRRTTLTSLIAVAVAVFGMLAAMVLTSAPAYASGSSQKVYLTFYGWYDNTPPGCAIAYPDIHQCAGGTGTYSDPITFASDKSEIKEGTKVYVSRVQKYFIMEDDCTECDEDWTGHGPDGGPGLNHIDLWIGGQNGNSNDVINCEDNLTQNSEQVVIDPPSTEPVDTTPLFNSSTNACYNPASFTGGGGGGGGTPGTIVGNNSHLCHR